MKILDRRDVDFMETLIKSNEKTTMGLVDKLLKKYYDKVELTFDYIYAEGDIPIALVAHMDTVFEKDALYAQREVYYDRTKNTMWCDKGGGFDDKAGIFAIFQILKSGLKPHVIFTTDEECGGLGAAALSAIPMPFKELKYIIQLDRRGINDCVFYDCDNSAFTKYVESFGFDEAIGSFSDISTLCPAWKVAGVNLSVGYNNEHTVSETLYVPALLATIEKVKHMLQETIIPNFEYIPSKYSYWDYPYGYNFDYPGWDEDSGSAFYADGSGQFYCEFCGQALQSDEVICYQDLNGVYKTCCVDCVKDHVNWCELCNDAFEIDPTNPDKELCPQCEKEMLTNERYNCY